MWKEEYSRFEGLTKETYDKYRYGLTHSGYFIYSDEPDEDGLTTLEILYLDSDDGCILFSSENEIFELEGMQIKFIGGCQYVDIRSDVLSEITELMTTFLEFQEEKYENMVMNAKRK